ncbi:MAG: hypothetical protein D6775_00775 [Caldilineae bacterium]|nr:MAG: hypothetical protein D6775_00775 [Caldilineae bacterium]
MTHKQIYPRVLFILFAVAWLLAAAMAPTERTLGTLVRWVYAHASLTQVSLLFFASALVLSVLYWLGREGLFLWLETMGWVALGLWLAGFVLSMVPAKLSWGVWVDFQEPRTQMTLRVLAVGLLFVVLTRWVDSRRFTAAAQIVLSALVLFLSRNTAVIRHPVNPIGSADSRAIPLAYSLIFLLALAAALALVYLIVAARDNSRQPSAVVRQELLS